MLKVCPRCGWAWFDYKCSKCGFEFRKGLTK